MKQQLPNCGYVAMLCIVLIFFPADSLSAQTTEEDSLYSELNTHQNQDSFLLYFKDLAALASYYKKTHRKDPKTRYQSTRALYEKYGSYREAISPEENLAVRKFYASYLNSLYKLEGFSTNWLSRAMKGHELVSNKKDLDRYSYNIEIQIGHYYASHNDYDQALQFYLMSLESLRKTRTKSILAITYADLGNGYKWQKNYARASYYFQLALDLANESGELNSIVASISKIGSLSLDQNDTTKFLKYYHRLTPLLAKLDEPHLKEERLAKHAWDYAIYAASRGDYNISETYIKTAHKHFTNQFNNESNRNHAKLDLLSATNFYEQTELKKATTIINQAFKRLIPSFNDTTQDLPTANQVHNENTILDLIILKIKIYQNNYQRTKKSLYLSKISDACVMAVKSNELLRDAMLITPSKVISTGMTRKIINYQVDNFYEQNKNQKLASTDFDHIKIVLTQSKNLLLNESSSIKKRIELCDDTTQTKINNYQNLIVEAIGNKENAAYDIEQLDLSIQQHKNQIIQLLNNCQTIQSLDTLSAENYLEYIVTESATYLLVHFEEEKTFHRLSSSAQIVDLITAVLNDLPKTSKLSPLNKNLDRLSTLLIPPGLRLPDKFSVILDGPLATLPFDLLRRNNKYLIQDHEVIVIQDAILNKKNSLDQLNTFILTPNYTHQFKDSTHNDNRQYLPLPFSKIESDDIAKNFNQTTQRAHLKRTELIDQLKSNNIFHFAGHAIIDSSEAYLVLNNGHQNAKWHEEQIRTENLSLSLVTLSACESGLGVWQKGDGIQSLGRSFLASGVDAVVYSLWTINDQSTAKIMEGFYGNIKSGLTINEALRKAKLQYIENAPLEQQHPYYWAAFVATGDTSISTVGHKNWYFLVLLLLIAGFLFILKYNQKT